MLMSFMVPLLLARALSSALSNDLAPCTNTSKKDGINSDNLIELGMGMAVIGYPQNHGFDALLQTYSKARTEKPITLLLAVD